MTSLRTAAAMFLGSVLLVGCHAGDESALATPQSNNVLDVHPSASASAVPVYTPVATAGPVTPMMASDSMAAAPATPAPVDVTTASSGTHVVKRGETMYSIAKVSYGDGKQWPRIASANPGVTPSGLKVGMSLAMP